MTIPPELNVYISGAAFVLGAYILALYVGMVVWAVRDIRQRSRDVLIQILVALLVVLFNVPGLLVYVLLRPHTTLAEEYERSLTEEALLQDLDDRHVCPQCQRRTEPDYIVCPHCHQQLRLRCVGCGRLLELNWDVCPYCGTFREAGEADDESEEADVEVEQADTQPLEQVADETAQDADEEAVLQEAVDAGVEAAEDTVAPEPVVYLDIDDDEPEVVDAQTEDEA